MCQAFGSRLIEEKDKKGVPYGLTSALLRVTPQGSTEDEWRQDGGIGVQATQLEQWRFRVHKLFSKAARSASTQQAILQWLGTLLKEGEARAGSKKTEDPRLGSDAAFVNGCAVLLHFCSKFLHVRSKVDVYHCRVNLIT